MMKRLLHCAAMPAEALVLLSEQHLLNPVLCKARLE